MSDWREGKPYRPNVGICLINATGLIWFGKTANAGPERVSVGRDWQMPQGGIEETEDIVEAATRELWEETGVSSVELLSVTQEWWTYDFPDTYRETGHKLDCFRGQKQKWVAFRFAGADTEIDISASHTVEPQEFHEWKWLSTTTALECAIAIKVEQYRRVFEAFDQHLAH